MGSSVRLTVDNSLRYKNDDIKLTVTYDVFVKQLVKGIRNMGNWTLVCDLLRQS